MIKVSEHFYSIQGEGPNVGMPSYMIRFSGCNFKCDYCDTKFSWDKDKGEDLKEVVRNLDIPEQCNNVIITGGEPIIHFSDDDFKILLEKIKGKYLEIETTGLLDISQLKTGNIQDTLNGLHGKIGPYKKDYSITQFRVSPKIHLSWIYKSITMDDICSYYKVRARYNGSFIYKIVFFPMYKEEIKQFLNSIQNKTFKRNKIFIMPYSPPLDNLMFPNLFETEYRDNCEETLEFCKEYGLRYTPRVQIDVYGIEKTGV